jgi:hypothetical protein
MRVTHIYYWSRVCLHSSWVCGFAMGSVGATPTLRSKHPPSTSYRRPAFDTSPPTFLSIESLLRKNVLVAIAFFLNRQDF